MEFISEKQPDGEKTKEAEAEILEFSPNLQAIVSGEKQRPLGFEYNLINK